MATLSLSSSQSRENRQAQRGGGGGGRGAGGGGGVQIRAEGAAAGRVRRAGRVATRHVEKVVELFHGLAHVAVVVVVVVVGGEAPGVVTAGPGRPAEHGQLFDGGAGGLFLGRGGGGAELVQGVDKVAARPVGAEADAVVGAAHVRLVLGVPVHGPQVLAAVGKLALFAVFADSSVLET